MKQDSDHINRFQFMTKMNKKNSIKIIDIYRFNECNWKAVLIKMSHFNSFLLLYFNVFFSIPVNVLS